MTDDMSDSEMQFGDLEESQPEAMLRPDQNMHYGVVACGNPRQSDLPIYVDVDVVGDILDHATSDTSVELGGVLLGEQCVDDEGSSFVVVRDCLRAEHYEATKGSFKFTHETWEQITRQREEFSPDLQMVGWYHTHPDWGVFLSGMDMFICDHFFNRSLDVALVVDPCRGDQGWFQWTGDPEERVRRTGGFYIVGSRFRLDELNELAAFLGQEIVEESDMAWGTRATRPVSGSSSSPVVHIHERAESNSAYVFLAMLLIQCVFLGAIAWQARGPFFAGTSETKGEELEQLAVDARSFQLRNEVQRRLLEEIAATRVGADTDWVERLEKAEVEAVRLRSALDAQTVSKETAEQRTVSLQKKLTKTNKELADQTKLASAQSKKLKTLEKEYDELEKVAEGKAVLGPQWYRNWPLILGALAMAVVFATLGAAGGVVYQRQLYHDWEESRRHSSNQDLD